ncbi:MAG: VWA domain-containing protein [Gemmatimonadaceae bacterium]|nr:VWA domain-containing protein [Gemmatimonadaceae bacterium]
MMDTTDNPDTPGTSADSAASDIPATAAAVDVSAASADDAAVSDPSAGTDPSTPGTAADGAGTPPADAGTTGPAGEAAPAAAAPPPQGRAKTKGVADVVFLVDISGSMSTCIDALRRNIEAFIDSLSSGDANNAAPVKDWRGKVVGYRDIEAAQSEGIEWIMDNPFVRDTAALKSQLAALRAEGGGDEPESLLDALYKVATMEALPKGSQSEDPDKWRYRSDAARVVVVFTDASFKETMSIQEAKGGSMQDVANVVMANRIILSLFAPNFEGYDRLSQIDKSEWEVIEYEGLNAQQALDKFTSDPANFKTTMKQLAASVSRSAETVAL